MNQNHIDSALAQFEYYKLLGEKTFIQLTDEQLFWQFNEESNSIAIIVKHMRGNMLSRWTDFLTTDGEKQGRNRDAEFHNDLKTSSELWQVWNEGWSCLFNAITSLTENDLSKVVLIRNQEHTVAEAIDRQVAHYAYHVGQIVLLGKMVCNDRWISLTIPKGRSQTFNSQLILK